MKWNNKREQMINFYNLYNKIPKYRTVTKFLLFPTNIDGVVRWLEYAKINQQLVLHEDWYEQTYTNWSNISWADIEDRL